MSAPTIVSRTEFEAAREALLAEEKAVTRARDSVAGTRRGMPMVRVDTQYKT